MVAALDRNEHIHRYARENHGAGRRDWRRQDLGSLGNALGWLIPCTARFPDHPNTVRIQSLRTDADADNWDQVDFVLDEGVPVLGAWIGARADCLYRVL